MSLPLYASLKTNDPDTFNEIVSIFDAKLKDGANLNAITGLTMPLIQTKIYSRIGHADDDTLLGFVDLLIDELQVLNKKKPLLCMQSLFPERFGQTAIAPYLPEAILAQEMGIMIDIMETYDPRRSIPELTEEQESLFTIAALKASNVYANLFGFLEQSEIPEADYEDACAGVLTMYDTIRALPREHAVPILRSMFAQ